MFDIDHSTDPTSDLRWTLRCSCGATVTRYRGMRDVVCGGCGATYNAGGQRLRDDYAANPSNWDEEIGDLEGFEIASLRREAGL